MATSGKNKAHLTIGWQVTAAGDPQYWLFGEKVKAGAQSETDLVQIPAGSIGSHTAIIAQSGSGKSFFLGRLIEEVLLSTKSRCLILDPNGDFRRVNEVEDANLWENAAYDVRRGLGKLPHEATQKEFKDRWSRVPIKIRIGRSPASKSYEPLLLWWPSISVDFFGEDVEPMQRSQLYHCHSFVKAVARLFKFTNAGKNKAKSQDLIDEAQRLFRLARQLSEADFRSVLRRECEVDDVSKAETARSIAESAKDFVGLVGTKWREMLFRASVGQAINLATTAPKYVSQPLELFYFAKAQEYKAAGILQSDEKSSESSSSARLE